MDTTETITIAQALSSRPARAICGMRIIPELNTMALGGVATGSMKAQLAASATGTTNTIGVDAELQRHGRNNR